MRLLKQHYRDRRGLNKETSKWYVEFKDHHDRSQRIPAFTSRPASQEFGRNLERLVAYFKASGGQAEPELQEWIAHLPRRVTERLLKIGLLDARRSVHHKPLTEHLDAFLDARRAKGVTEKQVKLLSTRITRVLNECNFRFWGDISSSKLLAVLNELRQNGTDDQGDDVPGISAQTFNFHLQAFKQFCRWAAKERLIAESPVAHLQGLNVRLDRRHDRRALSEEEFDSLLKVTRKNKTRFGMTGSQRALVYRLVAETGLRAGEVASLTKEVFRLQDDPPTVTVMANYSKRRREDVVPLLPETAEKLAKHLKTVPAKALAFHMPDKSAKMLREDLEAARAVWLGEAKTKAERRKRTESDFLKYRDRDGLVADFHALRHTFITNLARRGVHPKLAQDLARHCDVNLTLSRYSHTVLKERATALQALRPTPPTEPADDKTPKREPAVDGSEPLDWKKILEGVLPSGLPEIERFLSIAVDSGGLKEADDNGHETPENKGRNADSGLKKGKPPVGLEPTTCGLQNRCSAN